jgi:hypothetical protein
MTDGPDQLRSFLERMAREAAPGEALPSVVRRRVRRRQAGTALVAVTLMAGLAVGGVVGVRSLGGTTQRTIRSPLPSSPPPPTRTVQPTPSQPAPSCRSRWIIEPNPKVPGDYLDLLVSAWAPSSNDAWAVGRRFVTQGGADTTFALIEHWDGTKWTIVPGADQGGRSASLAAVAGTAPNDVWAVGKYEATNSPASREDPLIEHWDGRAWSIVPVPSIGQDQGPDAPRGLIAITPVSAKDIWALGYYGDNSGPATVSRDVFIHWDGATWKLVPSPQERQTKGISAMEDLSAVSSNDLWAVGAMENGFGEHSGAGSARVEHWDGQRWSRVTAPTGNVLLTRVAAISSDDLWAVQGGEIVSAEGAGLSGGPTGVLHWNGQAWSPSLSLPNADGTVITDITAVGRDDVWVVGMQGGRPLIRHWDGRKWTNPKGADSSAIGKSPYIWLTSVSRTAGHAVIAFGSEQDPAAPPQNRLWLSCAR